MNMLSNPELIDSVIAAVKESLDRGLPQSQQARLRQALLKKLTAPLPEREQCQCKEVTLLVSDLRGFTAIAERYPATTVIELLNLYYSRMCEIIYRYHGKVDKFMGDSILAVFGIPHAQRDDLERAIACAVEMQQDMLEVNRINNKMGHPRLFMGIGINTGSVVAGKLGSDLYSEYTVIGDEVNLASRIGTFGLRGQILLSEKTQQLAQDYIDSNHWNRVQIKGKQHPVKLYELLATRRPRQLEVPRIESRQCPRVAVDFPLSFQMLKEKQVADRRFDGKAVDLSYNGMQAYLPIKLDNLADIRIDLSTPMMANHSGHIYAKVLCSQAEVSGWLSHMEFTGIDDAGQAAINSYIDRACEQR